METANYLSPASNPELLGHEKAESLLLQALNAQRLHHAWLISGPRGIGKATLAYRFAKYVLANLTGEANLFDNAFMLAENPGSLYLSSDHPTFQRVAAGGHADVLVVEKSENKQGNLSPVIIAEDVRNVRKFFHMTAGEGGWRVVILDTADEMNVHASNALLKILEEPPSRALLMLISHNPGRLLPTIRSRCQSIRLEPLGSSVLAELLSSRAPNMPATDLEIISIFAEGSIGRALEVLELDGFSIYEDILRLFEAGAGTDNRALHAFASKITSKKGRDTFILTSELIRWQLGRIIKYAARDCGKDLTAREQVLFERISCASGLDRWLDVWEKVDDLIASVDHSNLDRKQAILNIFFFFSEAAGAQ